MFLDDYISKECLPGLWERHNQVVKLARSLLKDLHLKGQWKDLQLNVFQSKLSKERVVRVHSQEGACLKFLQSEEQIRLSHTWIEPQEMSVKFSGHFKFEMYALAGIQIRRPCLFRDWTNSVLFTISMFPKTLFAQKQNKAGCTFYAFPLKLLSEKNFKNLGTIII